MRRSTRIEAAASGKRGGRVSERIARHADRVRQGEDEDEEEWKPAAGQADEEEEEEDNHSSDSDFSEEEAPRPKAAATRASKRRMHVSSSDSSEEEQGAKAQVKQEQLPSVPGSLTKAREVMSRIRERSHQPRAGTKRPKLHQDAEVKTERVKTEKPHAPVAPKSSSLPAKLSATSELPDSHRRPSKQHQRVPKVPEPTTNAHHTSAQASSTTNNTLTHFSNEILEWNVFEALRRESMKEYDVSEANDGSEEGEVEITKVPSQFDSYDHYFSVWKPLALEEVQAQTVNSVTTDQPKSAMITATVLGSASFASKTSKVRLDFKKQSSVLPKRNPSKAILDGLYANDLVLITPELNYFSKALRSSSGRGKNHGKDKHIADRDDSEAPKGVLGIISSPKTSREGLIMSVLSTAWSSVDQEDNLYLFKLNNLITSVREFRALCDCRDYQLMPLILSGHHRTGSMRLDSLGFEYVRWLNRSFNESQLEAITAAATSEGFTLIKGPPGTGKTTTLKGLLNSLHLREYSRYYNAVLDVARRPDHETNKAWAAIGNEKPHILVAAPSNAAVDNIVAKVIEEGFCDGEGRRYFPKIIRVGRGMSASVRSVGLEDMVDQICSQPADVLENNILRLRYEVSNIERDAVNLREHLRQIVGWIEHDPAAALAAQIQPQLLPSQPQQEQQSPLQPHPLDLHSDSPPPPPLSPPPPPPPLTSPPGEALPSPKWSPDLPPPPSPSNGMTSSSGWSSYSSAHLEDDEDEEDEDFPAYGASFAAVSSSFSAQESGKAFSAFLDDSSSTDEDEPLPTKVDPVDNVEPATESPEASEVFAADVKPDEVADLPAAVDLCEVNDESDIDEPLPQSSSKEDIHTGRGEAEVNESEPPPPPPTKEILIVNTNNSSMEIADPSRDNAPNSGNAEVNESDPPPPPPIEEILIVNTNSSPMEIDVPNGKNVPMSPPPPPPLSPPPPPPLSPPPPSDSRPSSPMVMPLSPVPAVPPPTDNFPGTNHVEIDYTKYQEYRAVAQQINGCLEKLSEVKLELQRYEFARKMVGDRGKLTTTTRQSLEVSFLDTAHIVFTTLSSAGVAALDASSRYDVLVIDEAAQAVELSTIIPMKFGSRQCVLVGDPQQLSATVFSRTSGQSLYERSLFERLEACGHPVHMLRTQYRSHPKISDFPRHYFYEGKLQDGDNVRSEGYNKPYHHLGPAFTPLVFWNLLSSRESSTKSVSRMNIGEAELAVNLYLTLKKSCPPDAVAGKVGMITPYSQQMDELRNRFRRALGDRYDSEVEINTVDGFQGREKDIIILSTVRADPRAGVGFLNDIRRMNVALTRAKFACYVIGSEATLRSSKPWSALLDHAHNSRCVVHVENPTCNLITLQPMERPDETRRLGDTRKRSGSPPSHFRSPPAVGAPFNVSQYRQYSHHGQGANDNAPPHSQDWRGRGRGARPSSGDGRGRGGRRSGGQWGGRAKQGPGRGRGMTDTYVPPQPYVNAPPPGGGGGWHQPTGGMIPPQHAGQNPRSFGRERGFDSAPQVIQMHPPAMYAAGHTSQPPQPPPQSHFLPPPDVSMSGRGGGRNPRDPRFRNNGGL